MFPKSKTPRDKHFLKWIDSQPCIVRGCRRQSTHHHQPERGHGSRGLKCSDYRAIPMCSGGHHEELHQIGRDSFAAKYHVDYELIIVRNKERYQRETGRILLDNAE